MRLRLFQGLACLIGFVQGVALGAIAMVPADVVGRSVVTVGVAVLIGGAA